MCCADMLRLLFNVVLFFSVVSFCCIFFKFCCVCALDTISSLLSSIFVFPAAVLHIHWSVFGYSKSVFVRRLATFYRKFIQTKIIVNVYAQVFLVDSNVAM